MVTHHLNGEGYFMEIQDPAYLKRQYGNQDNLQRRIRTHELYGQPQINFAAWVLDHLVWQGDERVIDIGCGAGAYVADCLERTTRYVAGDLSFGMLASLSRPGLSRVNLNVQTLPFASHQADVVLANHMLYHVANKERAVAEIRRLLRPGGRLLATTNSKYNMAELSQLLQAVATRLAFTQPGQIIPPILDFNLEDGDRWLRPYFATVSRRDLPGALIFPAPQPVIDYLASMRERYGQNLPAGITWDHITETMFELLSDHIAQHGSFRVNKLAGLFICQ